MSLREKREYIQAQILETDRLLALAGDHPLMAPALGERKAEFERELKELPPPGRQPRTVLFFAGGPVLGTRGHELALRPKAGPRKLSWEETAREMAASGEDWSEWDGTLADGLESVPWTYPIPPKVKKWAKECAAKERQEMEKRAQARRGRA